MERRNINEIKLDFKQNNNFFQRQREKIRNKDGMGRAERLEITGGFRKG